MCTHETNDDQVDDGSESLQTIDYEMLWGVPEPTEQDPAAFAGITGAGDFKDD